MVNGGRNAHMPKLGPFRDFDCSTAGEVVINTTEIAEFDEISSFEALHCQGVDMKFSFFRAVVVAAVASFLLSMAAGLATAGQAYIVVDANTGKVLASENADVSNHPASLAKMMTLSLTFEALHSGRLQWDQQIVMTRNAASKIPGKLGLPVGQAFTVEEAVDGMIVKSANDAAAAMGDYLAGSEANFANVMTARARSLGMTHTVFRNASGLSDPNQVTTARDMAILASALIHRFPQEYKLFSMRSFEFRGKLVAGHNHLMYRYGGMDGIKTGFINASGYNIASSVSTGGKRLIGVVLGGKSAGSRDRQMAGLMDRYLSVASGGGPAGKFVASVPDDAKRAVVPASLVGNP
jgi:D-alanyl-D-alanine carboxypeptidase (penicillin-binding protein 5/6)